MWLGGSTFLMNGPDVFVGKDSLNGVYFWFGDLLAFELLAVVIVKRTADDFLLHDNS
jgi:hypothetical protein